LKGGEEAADSLYTTLKSNGIEVLYDDRDESPGVKFNDADLIGIPIRLTVSKRSLQQGGVELKFRQETSLLFVPLDEVLQKVRAEITALETAIARNVVEMK
jgi:prolyl-tRNA synthetase